MVTILFIPPSVAIEISKEDVLAKYEDVIARADELNIYREDPSNLAPKIRLATHLILRDAFEEAAPVLDEALLDLQYLELIRPKRHNQVFRLEWLEIYLDIFQKFAILAFLAFFSIRMPFFYKMTKLNRATIMRKFYLTVLVVIFGIFLSLFDLKRYGASSWVFIDYHVIFVAIGGFLGGFWPGLLSGIAMGAFRWFIDPNILTSFGITITVGLLSALFSHHFRHVKSLVIPFLVGVVAGAFHAIVIYMPMTRTLPWVYILVGSAFLVLLEGVAVLIFFAVIEGILREESRQEIKQELLKTQLLFLQAQINPHFLYNTLNAIAAICKKGNNLLAMNLILKLSEFLRRMIKRADEYVTLREEIAHVDTYVEIEQARFEERLRFEKQFDIPEKMWEIKIPILILQPLIENAIKHGIAKKKSGGALRMKIYEEDTLLKVEIADDGVGMKKSFQHKLLQGEIRAKRLGGIGIQNINQRLIQLWGPGHCLQFQSEPGVGTKVTVSIPLGNNHFRGNHS